MARIRTIKPEFFRHETLQELGAEAMLVFAGLLGHCDSRGRFEWRPRQLKLDILPFLPFEMERVLLALEAGGMLRRYSVDGKDYGEIPTFEKHQRLSGKEQSEGEKHPAPIGEVTGKQQGSDGEIPESQEGKGREGNRKGKESAEKPAFSPLPFLISMGVSETTAKDFLKLREKKRAPLTETAWKLIAKQIDKAKITPQVALEVCCAKGWQGFEAAWYENLSAKKPDKDWMFSDKGIEAKAKELGIKASGHDSYHTLKQKCLDKIALGGAAP